MTKSRNKVIKYDRYGNASWNSYEVEHYEVTGIDRKGKRFKIVTENWLHASGINVWQGSIWLVRLDGRRERIQTITN